MNGKKTTETLCMSVAILFLLYGPVFADTVPEAPTFLLPNNAVNNPVVFSSLRQVANGYALSSMYYDSEENPVWQQTGAVYSSDPASQSWGIIPDSYSDIYTDAGAFEAKSYHKVQTDGSRNNYSYGSAQVWNWYILAGNPGDEVTVTADIVVQGLAYANNGNDGNASTIFGVSLGFLASPEALSQDRVISLTGAVNWDGEFSTINTVDEDFVWNIGDDIHSLNYIIRSQPFTATVGVPFRLSLTSTTQGFAGPGNWGEAWSDFYDPKLVTSADFPDIPQLTPDGFAVALEGGQYSSLVDAGYSISIVPEPAALSLLGTALLGLVVLRKKFTRFG